ncbi:hypothetical protein F2Q69_00033914, partial [Brassica cretica]
MIVERNKQIQRIRSIFHRHLSVPLKDLSSTLITYKAWELEQGTDLDIGSDDLSKVSPQVAVANKKAQQMYSERAHLEENISKKDLSDTEKFQHFMSYIKFEQTSGDPTRVQAIYERAVAEFPVSSDLWIDYTSYLDKTLKVGKAITHAYSRATRSCPWTGDLWTRYLLALERGSASENDIYAVFEKSLQCTFSSFEEYLELYLTRVDGLRRRMISTSMVETLDYSLIRETFQQASDYLTPQMQNTDSLVRLHAYWANLELNIGKDLAGARGVWDSFLKKSGGMLAAWQAYIDMEVRLGHVKEARSIYRRCYTRKFDGTGSEGGNQPNLQVIHEESIPEEAIHDEAIHEEAIQKEAIPKKDIHDEAIHEEAIQEEAIQEEENPVEEEKEVEEELEEPEEEAEEKPGHAHAHHAHAHAHALHELFNANHEFFKMHAGGFWRRSVVISWLRSFCKQFYGSVTKSEYIALRHGFIMTHCPTNPTFNFHKYMLRTVEMDFKKVVTISWYLWLFVVVFLLLNVGGWNTYFWLSFLPLILLLMVGTKLENIISSLAVDVCEKRNRGEQAVITPSDELFWFHRPEIVLQLVHFILFQNSFEIAFFFWILFTYGIHSCIMEKLGFLIPRLVMGVLVQVLCSYSTLPLYALVTQMGSKFKKGIFDELVHSTLEVWLSDTRNKGESTSEAHRMEIEPTIPESFNVQVNELME